MSTADLVHIQWTGSNTHNNQPNGGDGQTGDAGEGQGGELKREKHALESTITRGNEI